MSSRLTPADFNYHLPPELIAQQPAAQRTASRLLHLDGAGNLHDRQFAQLPQLLRPDDLLVFNDTRVIKARLQGRKHSGGKVEVLIERVLDEHRALAHVRASKSPKPGTQLHLADAFDADVVRRDDDLFELVFPAAVLELLETHGSTPLPPYIEHTADEADDQRYQTVYAREPGAVAAPTAGLHFDESLMAELATRGVHHAFVTLHVGAGTFMPVRVDDLSKHVMHSERYTVPQATVDAIAAARSRGGKVVAVGTTSVRALEAAFASCGTAQRTLASVAHGDTRLFITPGYTFGIVDTLITNFHLPQSTLLMLISAFAGMERIRNAYTHAIAQRYRFFSYGDAMLIESPTVSP